MKPLNDFLQQLHSSTDRVRARDPAGATAIIQHALRTAGLLGAEPAEAEIASASPRFVDLNSAPPRARAGVAGTAPAQPSAGVPHRPAPLHGRGTFTAAVFRGAEGQRRYKLYVPPGPAGAGRALVVMLHGCTQDADDFATGTAMNGQADTHGCLVLYPEQDRSANANGCWNWFEAGHQAQAGEPAIIAAMTRQVMADYGIDPRRVYVAGLSAGGAMAAVLGAAYPDLFAGVGVHSGLPAGSARDMISGLQAMKRAGRGTTLERSVPIIVFHGDADPVVHADNGQSVLRQFVAPHGAGSLRKTGTRDTAAGHAYTRTRWHTAQGELVAEHWLVHGAAHAWQGGDPAGSHSSGAGPCAAGAMLEFFNQAHCGPKPRRS